ncbi:hypothetical protein OC726_02085 [Candidatus Phytoplasma aurantifolia]|uniref:Retron-type reverse transcriptase n=1 Tax=Candidatus Phytoplasma citri TaxID=180978 RepID=A0ABU8ZRK5_9MOLU|nr:hypothetical protein [Candidatus Phytoplasma aurantifolia]
MLKAERINNQVTQWLDQDLKLTISKDKSKIVKANKGTRFLSYMIKVNPTNKTRTRKSTKNSFNKIPSTVKFKSKFLK